MKVLVLGARGMAGHMISLYLHEQGYDVTAFARSEFIGLKSIKGDVIDIESLKNILLKGNWDYVINCIGLLNQYAESNPSNAIFINSYLPHFVADKLKYSETRLIHMSTDCVFAGNTGPYYEDSFQDGKSLYDKTKALGEINDDRNLTFRNSIVGPDIKESGIGLFNWFMKQKDPIMGYTGVIWTGVTTLELAKAMSQAMKENLTGLYNLVNNESINKFDLLQLFNKYFRDGAIKIKPDGNLLIDKSLRHKRNDFSFLVSSYEQQVKEMKDWMYNHKNMYPNYFEK